MMKMYEFEGSVMTWVCAENKEQAISIFSTHIGEDVWNETKECYGDEAVREMNDQEMFTYYHDGVTPEENSIGNLVDKYCSKPDMFATSDY